MDVEKEFRDLLTNQYQSNDQYQREFTFQTVFYKSCNTGIHCCCPCGFDHEFLTYITDGEINNEILEKILQNILRGKCPHVDNVPTEFVRETSVNGAHIAAAVGTQEVLREVRGMFKRTSIFYLDPYMVGLTKKNFRGLAQFYKSYINYVDPRYSDNYEYESLFIARKTDNRTGTNSVQIEATSVLALQLKHKSLIRFKDIEMFNSTLTILAEIVKCFGSRIKSNIPREFHNFLLWFAEGKNIRQHQFAAFCEQAVSETAFKLVTGKLKIVKQLLKLNYRALRYGTDLNEADERKYWAGVNLGQAAIIFDQPNSLNAFCKIADGYQLKVDVYRLGDICSVLQRRKCKKVLLKHQIQTPEPEDMSLVNKAKILFHVLDTVYQCDKQEIETLLKGLTEIHSYDRGMLQSYIQNSQIIDIRIIRILLELDSGKTEDTTILLTDLLIKTRPLFSGARAVVELLLYENFEWESNKTIVEEALELDAIALEILSWGREFESNEYMTGEYITDSKLHCSFKCNVLETGLHLEFYGALFIECGFPYTKDIILKYLDKQLHPREHEYLQQCIDKTRSLKLICRDCLRRHFKRKLRLLVESSGLPESLKDFILLKRELLTLK